MSIAASKVRTICTSSEAALVRASRRPQIAQLSHADVRRLSNRARKLFDKWQGLSRAQSRGRSRAKGLGESAANTQLKTEIFRDALESLNARLAALDGSGNPKGSARKTKRSRRAEHRAARAATRQGMVTTQRQVNSRRTPSNRIN
jgi:hypothetical protein